MVLPQTEALTPCLMGKCPTATRKVWKERYRYAKKYGFWAGFATITGTGLVTVAKEEASKGVKRHAKRYIGGILIDGGLTCVSAGLPLITNATKVVKYSKACHSVCAASWRAAHNVAEVPMILVDYAIFGEYVPSCGETEYDICSKTTDIVSQFTNG